MSAANDLIERMEKETGQRIDDPDNSMAMAGLIGAMSRMMGQSPETYQEKDDVAVGLIIQHQQTPEYQRKQEAKAAAASLLLLGLLD